MPADLDPGADPIGAPELPKPVVDFCCGKYDAGDGPWCGESCVDWMEEP